MTASHTEIVHHFLLMDDYNGNWGTSLDNSKWDVDDDTYINGIICTVDLDYIMGWVIEVVERSSSVVSYLAIVQFHGSDGVHVPEHDSIMMDKDCGIFFERKICTEEAALWGVGRIFGMVDSWQDAQRTKREKSSSEVSNDD